MQEIQVKIARAPPGFIFPVLASGELEISQKSIRVITSAGLSQRKIKQAATRKTLPAGGAACNTTSVLVSSYVRTDISW